MTIEEFDNTSFTGMMQCEFRGKAYDIVIVDFQERLIAIDEFDDMDQLSYKRCENIKIINQ